MANCQRSYWYINSVNDTGKHALPVSLTPAKTCIAGVIDTGEVGDVYFTPAMHALPVSLTPANACFAGVGIFVGEEFLAGVIDTGEAL